MRKPDKTQYMKQREENAEAEALAFFEEMVRKYPNSPIHQENLDAYKKRMEQSPR